MLQILVRSVVPSLRMIPRAYHHVAVFLLLCLLYESGSSQDVVQLSPGTLRTCGVRALDEFDVVYCSGSEGGRLDLDEEAGRTRPGTNCFIACKGYTTLASWRKCNDAGEWEGPHIDCNRDSKLFNKKKTRPKRSWGSKFRRFARLTTRGNIPSAPHPPLHQNSAPMMRNCPASSTQTSYKLQTTTRVYWTHPTAWDREQAAISVRLISGPVPGSSFSEGQTTIQYIVTDYMGASAYCTFNVSVIVTRCPILQAPSDGSVTRCGTSANLWGTTCSYSCDDGYLLSGPNVIECMSTGRYSGHSTCVYIRPTFTVCPNSLIIFAKKNERQVTVPHLERKATDNFGQINSTQTSGPDLTLPVGAGTYRMQFDATDATQNKAEPCFFELVIKTIRCGPPDAGLIEFNCSSTDYIWGTTCIAGCQFGYEVVQPGNIECTAVGLTSEEGQWTDSNRFTCRKVRCQTPETPTHGSVSCDNETLEWGATCSFSCDEDFRLSGPADHVCLKNASFDHDPVGCIDDVPPVFQSCPASFTTYPGRGRTDKVITWSAPVATDNMGGVNVTQKVGPGSGDLLAEGSHLVEYQAVDTVGNQAADCEFVVIVQPIRCPSKKTTDLFLVHLCSDSTDMFGTTCNASCPDGMEYAGAETISCEATDPLSATGEWTAVDSRLPRCLYNIACPIPHPPQNGALVCERKYGVCQYQCDVTHDSSRRYQLNEDAMLVCMSSGNWLPSAEGFDCANTRQSRRRRLPNEGFYFTGDCEDADTVVQMQSNFRGVFASSSRSEVCHGDCDLDQFFVLCG